MEKMTAEMGDGGGGGPPVSSRWNPTKEQISILENLYRQGVRTPSADQIQQITVRLKDYGHIEGKNVFYWFQNHKARQRQKQKQQHHHHHHFNSSFPFFNHFLHFNHNNSPFPPPPPPPNNVVCSPYYVHQNDVGLYPQYQNNSMVIQSGGIVKKRSKSERRNCLININEESTINNNNLSYQTTETLSLFPTHPTGDLQASPQSPPPPSMVPTSASDGISVDDSVDGRQPYFEFFM